MCDYLCFFGVLAGIRIIHINSIWEKVMSALRARLGLSPGDPCGNSESEFKSPWTVWLHLSIPPL